MRKIGRINPGNFWTHYLYTLISGMYSKNKWNANNSWILFNRFTVGSRTSITIPKLSCVHCRTEQNKYTNVAIGTTALTMGERRYKHRMETREEEPCGSGFKLVVSEWTLSTDRA